MIYLICLAITGVVLVKMVNMLCDWINTEKVRNEECKVNSFVPREDETCGRESGYTDDTDLAKTSEPRSPQDETGLSRTYKKTKSAADARGEFFEIKMATLIFLRCITNELIEDFKIAANMEAAGAFDDIILTYKLVTGDLLYCTLIQLKHKLRSKLNMSNLSQPKGDFSLLKYFISFLAVRDSASSNCDLKACGNFRNFQFILYTNAGVHSELSNLAKYPLNENISFNTGENGQIISLVDNETQSYSDKLKKQMTCVDYFKIIAGYFKNFNIFANQAREGEEEKIISQVDNETYSEKVKEHITKSCDVQIIASFLKKFYIYANQASEGDLKVLIKNEIKKIWQIPESETNLMYTNIFDAVLAWWRDGNCYLTSKSKFWLELIKTQVNNISRNKLSIFRNLKLDFQPVSLEHMKYKIKSLKNGIINVVVNGSHTLLTSVKVYYAVNNSDSDDQTCIVVSLETLRERSGEVLSAWKSQWCSALIVECEEVSSEVASGIGSELSNSMNKNPNLRLIMITTKGNKLARILKDTTKRFVSYDEQSHSIDMTVESQQHLLETKINFQGDNVSLSEIVGEDNSFTDQLSGTSLTDLVQPGIDRPIGKKLAKTIEYFIPRTLVSNNGTSKNTDFVADVKERVVLVVAKPGMGKSTFSTHLAETTKKKNPFSWVVRVNLADCSKYFQRLNVASINAATPMDFLKKCCTLAGTDFEKDVFRHCLRNENVVLIVDGIDEVCPLHEKKVILLFKAMLRTSVKQIWVTSRVVMKETLQTTLGVESRSLSCFTELNQEDFLIKFWKLNNHNLDEVSLKTFVQKLISRTAKSFDQTNLIIGIPQMTFMLAETYEKHLRKYCRTGVMPLPKRLDLLYLYDSFVKKKFDIYLTEKKRIDIDLAANKSDIERRRKRFLNNHMQAALMLILRSEVCHALKRENTGELAEFLKEIADGSEMTGIIDEVKQGEPHFIHRTLAEYFVGKWLAEYDKDNWHLLQTNMLQPSFKVVRAFFDRILAKNFLLQTTILNRDLKGFNRLLNTGVNVDEKDNGGRTTLLLAVSYSGFEKHIDFVKMTQKLLDNGASINMYDDVFQLRPLQLADKLSAWTVAGLILQNGGNENDMTYCKQQLREEVFKEFIRYLRNKDASCSKLMNISARYGELQILQYLVEERGADVDGQTVEQARPMHWAAEGGHVNIMKFLRDKGVSYDVPDNNGNCPLHYAVKLGNMHCIKFLVEEGANIESINNKFETPLMFATKHGDTGLYFVKYLIQHGSDINNTDKDGQSALHLASMLDAFETVKFLIRRGSEINKQNIKGESALHIASYHGYLTTVKCLTDCSALVNISDRNGNSPLHLASTLNVAVHLIEQGAHIDKQNNNNLTALGLAIALKRKNIAAYMIAIQNASTCNLPLHQAAKFDNVSVVKYFVNMGFDIEELDSDGNSALLIACKEGNLRVAKDLLDLEASINTGKYCFTPLQASAQHGHLPIVQLLLDRKADMEAVTEDGKSALWLAAQNGSCDVARTLLDAGAMMIPDRLGFTPLHISSQLGHMPVVQLLLNREADVEAVAGDGRSALWLAALSGRCDVARALLDAGAMMKPDTLGYTPLHISSWYSHLPVVQLLVERKADLEAVTNDGISALWLAAQSGSCDVVRSLLDSGASMKPYSLGSKPLHISAQLGNLPVVQLLIERRADVNALAEYGRSALWLAAQSGSCDVARALLDAGAMMMPDSLGSTPLHSSAELGHLPVVQLLLEQKANVESEDCDKRSPLHLAALCNKVEVVKYLIQQGANLNAKQIDGLTALDVAIGKNHTQVVDYLRGVRSTLTSQIKSTAELKMV